MCGLMGQNRLYDRLEEGDVLRLTDIRQREK
jgi:hypothetical protein